MRNVKILLEQVTKTMPPAEKQRHNLTLDENKNLVLHLMLGDQFIPVLFENIDFDKPIEELVKEISIAHAQYQVS